MELQEVTMDSYPLVTLSCSSWPFMHSASDMLTPLENPLGYLHKHLQQLLERQNNAKNNINTTLATLTIQLQQLI